MARRYAKLLLVLLMLAAPLAAQVADDEPLPKEFGSAPIARENEAPAANESMTEPLVRAGVGLMVLALICAGGLWLIRRNPKMRKFFSGGEAFKLVGRTFIGGKTSVVLLKVGSRVLVVGNAPTGVQLLSEISDGTEVSLLLAELEGDKQGSAKADFKEAVTAMFRREASPKARSKPGSTKLPAEPEKPEVTNERLAAIREEITRLTGGQG